METDRLVIDKPDKTTTSLENNNLKLYKSLLALSARIEKGQTKTKSLEEFFDVSLQQDRQHLRILSEHNLFSQPLEIRYKVEEILWRRGYYDAVYYTKRKLKYGEQAEINQLLFNLFCAGISHYHHILKKIENENSIYLHGLTDYLKNNSEEFENVDKSYIEWIRHFVQRILICMGDLFRYNLEIKKTPIKASAIKYYLQSIVFNPNEGICHNHIGTLYKVSTSKLPATFHYILSLTTEKPFFEAETNLAFVFNKNNEWLLENVNLISKQAQTLPFQDILISRFILLIDIWYFSKEVDDIPSLCHQILIDMEVYLKDHYESVESDVNLARNNDSGSLFFLMLGIIIAMINKLKNEDSDNFPTLNSFALAFIAKLMDHITNNLRNLITSFLKSEDYNKNEDIQTPSDSDHSFHPPIDETINKSSFSGSTSNENNDEIIIPKLKGIRRRRQRLNETEGVLSLSSESDNSSVSSKDIYLSNSSSENEKNYFEEQNNKNSLENSSDSEDDSLSDIYFSEELFLDDSPEYKSDSSTTNTSHYPETNLRLSKLYFKDIIGILENESLLQPILLGFQLFCCDSWLLNECSRNAPEFFNKIIDFFNILQLNTPALLKDAELNNYIKTVNIIYSYDIIPLPYDIMLIGIPLIKEAFTDLEWNSMNCYRLTKIEENLLRILKINKLGNLILSIHQENVGIQWNDEFERYEMLENRNNTTQFGKRNNINCFMSSNENENETSDPSAYDVLPIISKENSTSFSNSCDDHSGICSPPLSSPQHQPHLIEFEDSQYFLDEEKEKDNFSEQIDENPIEDEFSDIEDIYEEVFYLSNKNDGNSDLTDKQISIFENDSFTNRVIEYENFDIELDSSDISMNNYLDDEEQLNLLLMNGGDLGEFNFWEVNREEFQKPDANFIDCPCSKLVDCVKRSSTYEKECVCNSVEEDISKEISSGLISPNNSLNKSNIDSECIKQSEKLHEKPKEKLIQNLGQLWLKHKIENLETQLESKENFTVTTYVTIDSSVLTQHAKTIKQILTLQRCIIIVPHIVVRQLDARKREMISARDAIRFLETLLESGDKFIRVQRPFEFQSIKSIVGCPKRNDKEAWTYVKILECCKYFTNDSKSEDNNQNLTLLTGNSSSSEKVTLLDEDEVEGVYDKIYLADLVGIHYSHVDDFLKSLY